MKQVILFALLVSAGVVAWLSCSSDPVSGIIMNDYDRADLFKVEFVSYVTSDSNFAKVKVFCLVAKMGQGRSPFACGPTDEKWSFQNRNPLVNKTSDGKYFVYTAQVKVDQAWNVGLGLDAHDPITGNSGWLTPLAQAGCAYYGNDHMSFIVTKKGKIVPYADFAAALK